MNLQKFASGFLLLVAPFVYGQTQTFTPEKLWELKRINGGSVSHDQTSVLYSSSVYDMESNSGKSENFIYDLKKGTSEKIAKEFDKISAVR